MGRRSMNVDVAVVCWTRSYVGIEGTACRDSFKVCFDSSYTVVTSLKLTLDTSSSLWTLTTGGRQPPACRAGRRRMEGEETMRVRDSEGERHFHYQTQHTLDILLTCKHIRLAVRCILLGNRHSLPSTYFHGSCVLELHVKLLLPFISHKHMCHCCPQGMPRTHLGAIQTDVRPLFIISLKSCFWKINIVMYTCTGLHGAWARRARYCTDHLDKATCF